MALHRIQSESIYFLSLWLKKAKKPWSIRFFPTNSSPCSPLFVSLRKYTKRRTEHLGWASKTENNFSTFETRNGKVISEISIRALLFMTEFTMMNARAIGGRGLLASFFPFKAVGVSSYSLFPLLFPSSQDKREVSCRLKFRSRTLVA